MLFAIRDDEDRARGVGVDTEAAKLVTFAISMGITAMIGGVWAFYITYIYPQFAVDPLVTIGMVLMVYLGGQGDALGAARSARSCWCLRNSCWRRTPPRRAGT